MKARGFFLKREVHLGLHAQIGLPESGDGSALAEAAGLVESARSGVVGIDQQGGAQSELRGMRHGLGKEGGAHAFAALRRGDGERIDVVFAGHGLIFHALDVHSGKGRQKGEGARAEGVIIGAVIGQNESDGLVADFGQKGVFVAVEHVVAATYGREFVPCLALFGIERLVVHVPMQGFEHVARHKARIVGRGRGESK